MGLTENSQLRSRLFTWHPGDWLRDSVGLIVLHHLPKLQNLPGMWQFPTGSLTSRCVQECVRMCVSLCIWARQSLFTLWSYLFSGIKTGIPVLNYRNLHANAHCGTSFFLTQWNVQMRGTFLFFIIRGLHLLRWSGHCCRQYGYCYNSPTNLIATEWISINQSTVFLPYFHNETHSQWN